MELMLSILIFFGGILRIYLSDFTFDDHNGARTSSSRVGDGQKLLNIIIGIIMIISSIWLFIYYFSR